MVAKTYQQLIQLGEPFIENKKAYVFVQLKNGNSKKVRFYSPQEYAKMYPTEQIEDKYYKPQKEVLGFDKGYITIFSGVKEEDDDWFRQSTCRRAEWWGWYVISTEEVPEDLPLGVQPVRLDWDKVGSEDGKLKSDTEVRTYVKTLINPNLKLSVYQGSVGERIERTVKVIDTIIDINKFYKSTTNTHIMEDKEGNLYLWKTAAKYWQKGSEHHIKGTVKEYDLFEEDNITVLTRCAEVS